MRRSPVTSVHAASYGGLPYTRLMPTAKDDRLDLRMTSTQKALIAQAAALSGRSVTDFSTDVLTERAREVIARERWLRVDVEAFDSFRIALDEPAKTVRGLQDLLSRPSVFVD